MDHKYTLYVDESGDAGIKKIQGKNEQGASPYMVLGAVLLPNSHREEIRSRLTDIAKLLNKNSLHCAELNHRQKIKFIREILPEKMLFFSVLSLKKTLGSYRDDISKNHQKYYNKCVQYLLEKVGQFMSQNNIDEEQITVEFEDCGFEQGKLKNLLRACRRNPRWPNTKYLQYIDPNNLAWRKKEEEKLLEIADLVAHAVYQCAHKGKRNYFITEPRYFYELSSKFYACPKTSKIEGFGFKSVHKVKDLELDEDVMNLIINLKRNN